MAGKTIRNLQFGVGMSLLLLIATSIASYLSIQKQMENRESLSNSRRSITAIKDVLVSLLDAETGNRGFQITGKEEFLEPYNRGLEEFPKAIARLKDLGNDDKIQNDRVDSLQSSVQSRIGVLQSMIDKKRQNLDVSQSDMLRSKFYMDKSRKLVADFVKHEDRKSVV